MTTNLAPKWVECKCGNRFEVVRPKTWCQKCCQPVFYDEKDQRRHQLNQYYMVGVMAAVIMLVTYFFIEIVAVPLLG